MTNIKIPIFSKKTVETYIELNGETPLYFQDTEGNQYKLNRYCFHKLFKNGGYCHYSFEDLEAGAVDFSELEQTNKSEFIRLQEAILNTINLD